MTIEPFDDPQTLGARIARAAEPVLIGLDCDGVLAPIVAHADDARLLDGVGAIVERLAEHPDITVAVVSGRSLAGLAQFGFGPAVIQVGSHGAERRGGPEIELTPVERGALMQLIEASGRAAHAAGDGAWVERKPAGVALHVREADDQLGSTALSAFADEATAFAGVHLKPGSAVLEATVRPVDKGTALGVLRDEVAARTCVFVGDDRTDEDAFRVLTSTDFGVKVGPGPTAAAYRIPDPLAARSLLESVLAAREHR